MNQTTLLLTIFFCHFLADYTHLSTAWMLNAKRLGKPFFPILIHASVHGLLMFVVLSFWGVPLWLKITLTTFQVVSHSIIDLIKGRANGWFPVIQSPSNKWHWIVFGFDQFLHAVVIITMVHLAVK